MSHDQAEPVLLEALQIATEAEPQDYTVTAMVLERLGDLYQDSGDYDASVDAYERALDIRQIDLSGEDDLALAEALYKLGLVNIKRDRFADAEVYLSQAVALYRSMVGDDVRTAQALRHLAQAEEEVGRLDEAETHLREAYDVWSAVEAPDSTEAIRALERLVQALTRWGRYNEGVIAGQRLVALRENAEGRDSPDLIPSLVALGISQGFSGETEAAEAAFQRALNLAETWYGAEAGQTLAVWDSIGWLAWQSGDYEKAREIHQSLLDLRMKTFDSGHFLVAFTRLNLGLALAGLGRYEEADALVLQAEITFETSRGSQHRATARALHYLGLIRWHLGETSEAVDYLQRALQIREALFPETHPDVQRSRQAVNALRQGRRPPPVTAAY